MFEAYEVGARCWLPSPKHGWVGAQVVAKRDISANECEVDLEVDGDSENDPVTKKLTEDPSPGVPLRNPPALEATSDLVTLSYLNEPSVLYAIRQRYAHLNIYTFSGIVLIATNPFDRVDNLYTNEMVQMYSGRERGELEPHLFSIAEDALRCMQRDNKNQTIIVSGESGAGKTMSAKYIMRYFATVEDPQKRSSGRIEELDAEDGGLSRTEREILATNPIMEAFGNAKTTRNDNSSRFGKYLEIRFDRGLNISGARIRTYLLERSRIVYHPETERNYHIFYQLLAGLGSEELAQLGLGDGLEAFAYVNVGSPVITGVDDGADFAETRRALQTVGVDGQQQWKVFEILAALLHIGNIQLRATSMSVSVSPEDPSLLYAAKLLGVPSAQLAKWLVKKLIMVRNEKSESSLNIKAATVVRDSIAKYLYSALFDWLVSAVNSKLFTGNEEDQFIGVLDIYGFEHFKHNSFEQFCINYANEKLQQEFNQHVFKLEQEEYASEDINWQYIDFVDNQPCITLIEAKTGILGLLDDESRVPSGSDDGFTQKLYGTLTGKPHFRKPRLGESSFIVAHYAHDVEYETAGFIEKNRDTVPDTIINLLNSSENEFLSEILETQGKAEEANTSAAAAGGAGGALARPRGGVAKRPTLGNIFKRSLIELMDTISSTNAHYIRCIKPNEEKQSWMWDGPMVLNQLRACGVLETIRISSKGFPGRHYYQEFLARYEILLHSAQRATTMTPRDQTVAVLEQFSDPSDGDKKPYALGKTKVFSRAGMLARLENRRTKRLNDAAVAIQCHVKMHSARGQLVAASTFVRSLQTALRGHLARQRAERQRVALATVDVQSVARRFLVQRRLQTAVESITALQRLVRTKQSQERQAKSAREDAALALQSMLRGAAVRRQHNRHVAALTTVQSMVRRRDAARQLQKLREDQHSVKHFEEAQYRLENKVVELQNALAAKRQEHRVTEVELATSRDAASAAEKSLAALMAEHERVKTEADSHRRELEASAERLTSESEEAKQELASRSEQMSQLQDTLAEQEHMVQTLTFEMSEQRRRNAELEEQLEMARAEIARGGSGFGGESMMARSQNFGDSRGITSNAMMAREDMAARGGRPHPGFHPSTEAEMTQLYEQQTAVDEQIEAMLQRNGTIKEELITKLIHTLEVPSVRPGETLARRDVLFPANITNLMISELWRFGLIQESERMLGAVLGAIQTTLEHAQKDEIISLAPFWITNVHEIHSFMVLADANINRSIGMVDEEKQQYAGLVQVAKGDLETMIFNIYFLYMKFVKKHLDKMIIPAVIEDQNIPGFQVENSQGLFNTLFRPSKDPIRTDDLVVFLNKLLGPMQAYHLEPHYIHQPLKEIMTFIALKSFNDMIVRRNFLSWRRSVQINYNVTRLIEWARAHHLEGTVGELEPIFQATKLLQLKSSWDEDIKVLFDVFWALNPSQIQRLLLNYQLLDYEPPISQQALDTISAKIMAGDSPSDLALKMRTVSDAGPFDIAPPRQLRALEPYIPANITVPNLRDFTLQTTKSSRLKEMVEANYIEAEEGREDDDDQEEPREEEQADTVQENDHHHPQNGEEAYTREANPSGSGVTV